MVSIDNQAVSGIFNEVVKAYGRQKGDIDFPIIEQLLTNAKVVDEYVRAGRLLPPQAATLPEFLTLLDFQTHMERRAEEWHAKAAAAMHKANAEKHLAKARAARAEARAKARIAKGLEG